MMARVLRTELRRSSALWTAIALVVLGAAMLYPVVDAWGGRWMPLALWQREYLFVLWPMALGAGAWQARRESRAKVGELFGATPRPRWQRVAPTAGAMAVAMVAGYLGMFAAGAVSVVPSAGYFPLGLLPVVAVGALSVVAAVVLGLAIGRMAPSAFTPPALAVGGLVLLITLPLAFDSAGDDVPGALLLSPVLYRPDDDFVTVAASAHLAQVLWLVALLAAGFLFYAAVQWRTRALAAVPAVLGAVVALAVAPGAEADVTVPDLAARKQVCTSDAPKVCVAAVHASALEDLRGPGQKALTILAAKLPLAPTSVAESPTLWLYEDSRPQPAGTLLVDLEIDASGGAAEPQRDLLWQLLDGAGTRRCANTVNDYWPARLAAAAWLMGEPPPARMADSGGQARKLWDALGQLPADEQRARVAALRTAALACATTDLAGVLTRGSAPR